MGLGRTLTQPAQHTAEDLAERLRWSAEVARVIHVGIQKGYGLVPDLFLFQPTRGVCCGSTLAIPLDAVSPLAISNRIREAEKVAA